MVYCNMVAHKKDLVSTIKKKNFFDSWCLDCNSFKQMLKMLYH